MRFIILTLTLLVIMSGISAGAGKKISESGNKHNFSASNTAVTYRATDSSDPRSQQICVFCHTPHRASSEGPLWNRKGTTVSFFKRYSSTTLAIDDAGTIGISEYGQPNGSSRLCLSCHDGVTALGAVFTTPGVFTSVDIPFTKEKIGYETYSSHHPVSFKYTQAVRNRLTGPPYNKQIKIDPPTTHDANVKLDKLERMQCTTCHDPHQDKSTVPGPTTPFWTTTTYEGACLSCHDYSGPPAGYPYPWKP